MEVDASDDHLYELLYIIIIYSGLCYLLRFSLLAVCSAGISSEQISAPRDFIRNWLFQSPDFFQEICQVSCHTIQQRDSCCTSLSSPMIFINSGEVKVYYGFRVVEILCGFSAVEGCPGRPSVQRGWWVSGWRARYLCPCNARSNGGCGVNKSESIRQHRKD
jgi:hypothetical protein